GFVAGERIVRMEGRGLRPATGREGAGRMDGMIRPVTDDDIERLSEWDTVRFGANRSRVLRALIRRKPEAAFVCEQGDEIRGFVLARDGRKSTQIGPLMADDEDLAIVLVEGALAGLQTPSGFSIAIDVLSDQAGFVDYLESRGIRPTRGFTRMAKASGLAPGRPGSCFSIGGPELG
ncbi:MAG: hypothetical protein KDE46_30555, partial [Caldilineaceae bacterium]|nr:hypothetical protein [Caldilineaceae bacterium]